MARAIPAGPTISETTGANRRAQAQLLNRTKARGKGDAVSFVCVPLVHGGQVVGTLSACRDLGVSPRMMNDRLKHLGIQQRLRRAPRDGDGRAFASASRPRSGGAQGLTFAPESGRMGGVDGIAKMA